MRIDLEKNIEFPQDVVITVDELSVFVKGPKGEVSRKISNRKVNISIIAGKITLSVSKGDKKDKTAFYTLASHLQNMIEGVQNPWVYKLKVCNSHFPITVKVEGDSLSIKNLLGEKIPRLMKIRKGASVKVEGQDIKVVSSDIEIAGTVASDIEQLTRITKRDRRIFQDGIYVYEKGGVPIR